MKVVAAVILAAILAWAVASGSALAQTAGIKVIVNGVEIPLVAPAVLSKGQVMAPIGGLFEPMGAIAAFYEADRSIVVTNRVRTTVRMRVNEPTALVNGQSRLLPVAPMQVADRVFVPVQAVFSALGAWTKYEDADRTLHVSSQITGLAVQRVGDGLQVSIDATGPVQVETNVLTEPDRLVVDFFNAALRTQEREIAVNGGGVARVRSAQFQVKPYVSRLVFDLTEPVDVRVTASSTTYQVTLELHPKAPAAAPPAGPPAGPPAPSVPPTPAPAAQDGVKILNVAFQPVGSGGRVSIEGTGAMQYKVREFVFPDRLAIDIQDAVFIPVKQEIPVDGTVIVMVRGAQFAAEPPVTRVVVTLKRKTNYLVNQAGGRLTIDLADAAASRGGHVVAIDAGHGGKDPGAIGPTGLRESEVVLDVSLRLRDLLAKDGIRTVMTRETDVFVDLFDRTKIARERGATIMVSIHANAHAQTAVNGSETYYLTPQSLALAQMIQDELGVLLGIPSRGVKTANFVVLRESGIPSVLVETAFISHPDDEVRLRDLAFRQRVAQAIYRGITRFLAVYPVPAGN
jgi:N-acetylmuramoyl-L-alanine amidase